MVRLALVEDGVVYAFKAESLCLGLDGREHCRLKLFTEAALGVVDAVGGLGYGIALAGALLIRISLAAELKFAALALAGLCRIFKSLYLLTGELELLADGVIGADGNGARTGSADLIHFAAAESIYLVTETVYLKVAGLALDEQVILALFDHGLDVAVHRGNDLAVKLDGVVDDIAVICAVFLGKRVVYVLVIVLIEYLRLTVGIEQRPKEREHKHEYKHSRAENRQSVAYKALKDLTTGGENLDAGYVVQMYLFVFNRFFVLLGRFLGLEDFIQII